VLATYLAGSLPDLERLRAFCDERHLLLIESAPHHLGCRCADRMVGTWGDLACGCTSEQAGSPETWALALARPEFAGLFAQEAPRPESLPFILHHARPVTTLGLSLSLETSRHLAAVSKRRRSTVAELRAFCSSYPDLLTVPGLHSRFSADSEGFTVLVQQSAPFSPAELAAALAAASVSLLPADIRIGPRMRQVYGLEARQIGGLPNTAVLLERGLNIAVGEQDGAAVCAALARFIHAQPARR
jgi:dTDP-4-amino-4,6-dideoxygalactose transaminase